MTHTDLHWPDEAVRQHFRVDPWPELSIPFRVLVFVFHTTDQLRAACEDPLAVAHSISYRKIDADGVGAVIMLSAELLEVSLVAHEATHVALYWWSRRVPKKRSARRVLRKHSERVPDMVGYLTDLIWHSITPTKAA